MKDEEIIENVLTLYNAILKVLPRTKENVKNLEIKFTMSKPQKLRIR
jgi:ribosomal protein L1